MAVPPSAYLTPRALRARAPGPVHGTRLPSVHQRIGGHVSFLRVSMHAMRLIDVIVHCTVYSTVQFT